MRRKAPASREKKSSRRLGRVRIGIIRSEYNSDLTRRLATNCRRELLAAGLSTAQVDEFSVPGCFEIPWMAQRLARRRRYDVLIALGVVIRGKTLHFDLVTRECARGVMQVSLAHDVPVVFEVIAAYSRRDAQSRAGSDRFNRGLEAAQTALSLLPNI
jgi:6,7-dimethyl-8-ribityllumazine synthase